MAVQPTIPMSPEALPKQFLYVVPSMPTAPEGWIVDLENRGPGLPQKMPYTARYLAQLEWSWSPIHHRIDAYHLSLNKTRDRWLLWGSYFDQDSWKFIDNQVVASGPRCKLTAVDAATLLLYAYWANESRGEMELDAPHWINEPGLLDVARLKEIERTVWNTEEALSKEEMLAYQRKQDRIDEELLKMGAIGSLDTARPAKAQSQSSADTTQQNPDKP